MLTVNLVRYTQRSTLIKQINKIPDFKQNSTFSQKVEMLLTIINNNLLRTRTQQHLLQNYKTEECHRAVPEAVIHLSKILLPNSHSHMKNIL